MNKLEEYYREIESEIFEKKESLLKPSFQLNSFCEVYLEKLSAGNFILEDYTVCYLNTKKGEIHGYAIDLTEQRLDLFIALEIGKLENAPRNKVMRSFDKISLAVEEILNEDYLGPDEDLEVDQMIKDLKENFESANFIRFFVLTDGTSQKIETKNNLVKSKNVQFQVYDITRLNRIEDESIEEIGEIDFGFLSEELSCTRLPQTSKKFSIYQTHIRGDILAEIYAEHGGQRLLDLNVRSYLQNRIKVNKGIKSTIENGPENFIAFNNGITVVTNKVEINEDKISKITGMQIVNGGQTTVSLFNERTSQKGLESLKKIQVSMKLIEVHNGIQANFDFFKDIATFSNSQTAIKPADLHSLDEFFKSLETLSRSKKNIAPPGDFHQVPTQWYFERTKGQFRVWKNQQLLNGISRSELDSTYPSSKKGMRMKQVFTKEEFAKSQMAWLQMPNHFAKSSGNCFTAFMRHLDDEKKSKRVNKLEIDNNYYKNSISKLILNKTVEELVAINNQENDKSPGYNRQPLVGYLIAVISLKSNQGINLKEIWEYQKLSPDLVSVININIPRLREYFDENFDKYSSSPAEWAKTEKCWNIIKKEFELTNLDSINISEGQIDDYEENEDDSNKSELPLTSEFWWAMYNWAKKTELLEPREMGMCASMARLSNRKKEPTDRQIKYAEKIYFKAIDSGFEED